MFTYDLSLNSFSGIPSLRLNYPVMNLNHNSIITLHPVTDRGFGHFFQIVKKDLKENIQKVEIILSNERLMIRKLLVLDEKRDIV